MDVNILNSSKDEIEVELKNVTLAEILKVYLNKDSSVKIAAWKREHPTEKPILFVKASNPKKAIKSAIDQVVKELDKFSNDFAKMK